jgi:hypothetical protein
MRVVIQDFSIESAFRRIHEELTEEQAKPELALGFINTTGNEAIVDLGIFEGKGIVFGQTLTERGDNLNETKSQVINNATKGAKKYKTVYLGVYDHKKSMDVYTGARSETKGECVDKCRLECELTGRNLFVIIGKATDGFDRMEAEIRYKPSSTQEYGKYEFVW